MSKAILPLKRLATFRNDQLVDQRRALALDDIESWTGRLVPGIRSNMTDAGNSGVAAVESGDVLFGKLRPYLAKSFVVAEPMAASTELICLRPKPIVDPRWLGYVTRSQGFIDFAVATSEGTKMPRTSWEKLGSFQVGLPPLAEQRAIADYLDVETARIDALIAKKQLLIRRLDERWNSQLGSAFDNPSGIRLKQILAAPMAYGVLVPDHSPDGPMMLRIGDFAGGAVDIESVARISSALHSQYGRTIVNEGDLVISVVGTLGRAAVIPKELAGANLNRALARVQLRQEIPVGLIRMWCASPLFQEQARSATGSDSAQPTLNLGDLRNFQLGLPHSVREWTGIYDHLWQAELRNRNTRASIQRQINLLTERRQAAVSAAVTGQPPVR